MRRLYYTFHYLAPSLSGRQRRRDRLVELRVVVERLWVEDGAVPPLADPHELEAHVGGRVAPPRRVGERLVGAVTKVAAPDGRLGRVGGEEGPDAAQRLEEVAHHRVRVAQRVYRVPVLMHTDTDEKRVPRVSSFLERPAKQGKNALVGRWAEGWPKVRESASARCEHGGARVVPPHEGHEHEEVAAVGDEPEHTRWRRHRGEGERPALGPAASTHVHQASEAAPRRSS